jgi:hypothetical protein
VVPEPPRHAAKSSAPSSKPIAPRNEGEAKANLRGLALGVKGHPLGGHFEALGPRFYPATPKPYSVAALSIIRRALTLAPTSELAQFAQCAGDPIPTRIDDVLTTRRSSVAGTQRWSADRDSQDRGSSPLPSFDMPSLEAVDPDKTLKRRRIRSRVVAAAPAPNANATEEIRLEDVLEVSAALDDSGTGEIDAEDILDVIPLRQRVYPNPRITMRPEAPESFDPVVSMPAIPPAPLWNAPIPTVSHAPIQAPYFAEPIEAAPATPVSKISTIAPVAFDLEAPRWPPPRPRMRAESTFSLETLSGGKRRRLDVAIAVAIGAFVGIFVLGFALRSVSAKPVVRAFPAAAAQPVATGRAPIGIARTPVTAAAQVTQTPVPVPVTASTDSKSSTPTLDVTSLPLAPVGTVSLAGAASGHRLFVDGVVASRGTALVTCGKHVVRVGSHGHAQVVDVTCGSEVLVGP